MHLLEIILFVWLVGMPIYTALTFEKSKQKLIDGTISRIRAYQDTILFLWLPAGLLFAIVWQTDLTFANLGFGIAFSLAELIGIVLLVLLTVIGILSLLSLRSDEKAKDKLRQAYEPVRYLMPLNRAELGWFNLGVSPTAGFCEEMIFRGYLLWVLTPYIGLVGAILVSSLLFGLNHIYQGWGGVLRTGLMGFGFAFVFWATGSLWLAILLHALVDMFAGMQSYLIYRDEHPDTHYDVMDKVGADAS